MSSLLSDGSKERLLTVRWNNTLTAGLGIPMVAFASVALSTSALSDRAAFWGVAILGAFY